MPTPPNAKLLVSVNGDAPTSGGIAVANGDTIAFSYESTAFWQASPPARLEFYAYPSGWSGPGAPWTSHTVNITVGVATYPFTVYYYLGATPPPPFTMPAGALWGKFLMRLTANGGIKDGAASADLIDESTALEIISPSLGLHDLARFEGAQFGGADAWVAQQAENLRALDTALGGVPSLSDATPAAVADAGAAGASTAASRADHVHPHGNLAGGEFHDTAVSGGAAGFISGPDQQKLDGIETGADVTDFENVSAALQAASGFVSFNGERVTDVADPTGDSDATNRLYVTTYFGASIYTFLADGSVAVPAGAKYCRVQMLGGGGGGGGGSCRGAGVANGGGGGGAGGSWNELEFECATLAGQTVTIVVGQGGGGGAGASTNDGNGTAGTAGGASTITINGTVYLTAGGSGGGGGGTAANGTGGTAGTGVGLNAGGAGAAGSGNGSGNATSGGGGGGGGALTTGNVEANGGTGGSRASRFTGSVTSAGGTLPGGTGTAGQTVPVLQYGAGGGGGGASSATGAGGNGGAGGLHGGGGGGGGAARNGQTAGTGGAGTNGIVVITFLRGPS